MTGPARRVPAAKPTLRDVSVLAGVSRMTVTRVFIRPEQVLPATRTRVRQAVEALGYVPDRAAGSLATRRSGFVGLIVPTVANGNFAALAEGLTEALRPAGYELLIGYTSYSLAEEERQVRTLLSRRPEALVLAAPHREPVLRQLGQAGVPVIEVAELPARPIGHAIGFSNHAVGRAAASFLVGLGHTRIAALGPARSRDRRDLRGEARLRGFADALRAARLPTELVRADGEIPFAFRHGALAMGRLLDAAPKVEAVFAVSDLAGVGALMECRRRGIDVPGGLSLLGFGDFEIGQQVVPALSTVSVDFGDLGNRAGRLAVELLQRAGTAGDEGDVQGDRTVDLGFTVVPRGTTRARSSAAGTT